MLTEDDIYPTRGNEERLTERKDPVLYGWEHYNKKMTEEELESYEKNGFVVIPGVFSRAEVENFKGHIAELKKNLNLRKRRYWSQALPPGEQDSLFAPESKSELFQCLIRDRRILDRIKQIVGAPMYLHRSRVHVQNGQPGGRYPWHSEFEAWHAEDGVPRMRGVEVWIMLNATTPENAAMRMLAGSHYIYAACQRAQAAGASNRPRTRGSYPSPETLTRLLYFGGLAHVSGQPGSIVICDSNLMYGSENNTDRESREMIMLSYNSMENRPARRPFATDEFRSRPLVSPEPVALKPQSFDFSKEAFPAPTRKQGEPVCS